MVTHLQRSSWSTLFFTVLVRLVLYDIFNGEN
jgi:hypothetical protein